MTQLHWMKGNLLKKVEGKRSKYYRVTGVLGLFNNSYRFVESVEERPSGSSSWDCEDSSRMSTEQADSIATDSADIKKSKSRKTKFK